jgi:hypothetical protein
MVFSLLKCEWAQAKESQWRRVVWLVGVALTSAYEKRVGVPERS